MRLGRGMTNSATTFVGASIGARLFCSRMTWMHLSRHGLRCFEDSIMRPLPTCRLDPCGRGCPGMKNVVTAVSCPVVAFG